MRERASFSQENMIKLKDRFFNSRDRPARRGRKAERGRAGKERENMGRPSMSEQRRIEIGRALQTCMIRNGSYEITSVKDIAQEAGVATSLVHHYFTNKDEILSMMADMELMAIANLMEDVLRIREKEERLARLHELLADTSQSRFLMILYALSLSMTGIHELVLAHRSELAQSLVSRLRRRGREEEEAERIATELVFLLESAVLQAAVESSPAVERLLARSIDQAFPISE